jgi:hypothetical protein
MLDFVSNYHDVRKRLGLGICSVPVPSRRCRDPRRLDATLYDAPIGPKALIYSTIVVRDLNNPLHEIAKKRGLKMDDVLGKGRSEPEVACRAVMAHYLRSRGLSFPRIGQMLNRDHTSILHLINTRTENGERIR